VALEPEKVKGPKRHGPVVVVGVGPAGRGYHPTPNMASSISDPDTTLSCETGP
jgi:hypothetical protein